MRILLHPFELACALYYDNNVSIASTRRHLELTAAALLNASKHARDGGYALRYSLYLNWDIGYIETTGYIIPTALELAQALGNENLRRDALSHGAWLLDLQCSDGGFPGASRGAPIAFDTAQVLIGLQRLFRETGENRYLSAAVRAAEWLVEEFDRFLSQDPDGSSRELPAYNARSAGALIEFGVSQNEHRYVESGEQFLNWVLRQRLPTGLFESAQLRDDPDFLLHTSMYVLEGFLMAHTALHKATWLQAAIEGAECFKRANLERDDVLYSYYDADMNPTTREWCLVGLSQWAGLCLNLYEITGEAAYKQCAERSLRAVKSKQIRAPGPLCGAIPGSAPFWGRYERMAFPNWNLKYFADALLNWQRLGLDASDQPRQLGDSATGESDIVNASKLTTSECVTA